MVGSLLVILPWTLRNYVHFQKIIPISNNGGINFWIGNNPRANGNFVSPFFEGSPFTPLIGDEVRLDEVAYQFGFEFIRQNPGQALKLLPAKVFYLYNANDAGLEWNIRSAIVSPSVAPAPELTWPRI